MELKPLTLQHPLNVTVIRSLAELKTHRSFFLENRELGWDTETNPLKDFFWRKCRLIQFGTINKQIIIDLLDICGGDAELLSNCQGYYGKNLGLCPELKEVIEFLVEFLCSFDWLKIGVNLGFEYMVMYWNFGIRPFNFYDCMLAEKAIYAGLHSLKDFHYYSMEEMMIRYFHVQIDKTHQTTFDVGNLLTLEQYEYAALDTRLPFAIRSAQVQIITGETIASRCKEGLNVDILKRVDPLILGDNLELAVKIENDAIGSFQEMHIHGENIDTVQWMKKVKYNQEKLNESISKLDEFLIPVVGTVHDIPTDEEIAALDEKWKSYRKVTPEETQLKKEIRKEQNLLYQSQLSAQLESLEKHRLGLKEKYKKEHSDLGKKRTKIKNLADKCQGKALIDLESPKQVLEALIQFKGLKNLEDTNDNTLEQYLHVPIIPVLQDYRGYSKELGTYGTAWATKWVTHPCKEEGWLHPGDGRIHHVYNQFDADTGRSSSEQPNGQNITTDPEERPEGYISSRECYVVDPPDEIAPEGYDYITADMSGAELRIIAEESDDQIWIEAFARGEDLHSVGTELLYPVEWPEAALPNCAYYKPHTAETVAKNPLCTVGEPQRQKCKCPKHKEMRNGNKSTNFLLAYGGGPGKLSKEIKKTFTEAKALMAKHEAKFPRIWEYLEENGQSSRINQRSFDMFGGRRLFPKPDWDRAKEKAFEDRKEKLEYSPEVKKKNIEIFVNLHNRKPNSEERKFLTHRQPNSQEIGNAFKAMGWSTERQGKNHSIQGANARIAKIAMGAGVDRDGKPFLFHVLPKYHAKLKKFVHDELVIQCPKRYSTEVAALVGDAFKRAAAVKMKKVVMEFDFKIAPYWCK